MTINETGYPLAQYPLARIRELSTHIMHGQRWKEKQHDCFLLVRTSACVLHSRHAVVTCLLDCINSFFPLFFSRRKWLMCYYLLLKVASSKKATLNRVVTFTPSRSLTSENAATKNNLMGTTNSK